MTLQKKIKKYKFKSYSRTSGNLLPINFDQKFPFKAKRIFFIYGKKNKIRGEHAHKKCAQLFFPIFGKLIIYIETPYSKKKVILSHLKKTAILVPPKYWCSVKFIKKNSILMVACDKYYNVADYLESFAEYKKYLGKS